MKKFLLKRWLWLIPGILAFLLTQYAKANPVWTEQVYSLTIYPKLTTVVGFLPSLISFSLTEWVVVLFIIFVVALLIFYIRKIIKGQSHRGWLAYKALATGFGIFSVVYFVFTALCGLNYYRQTFTYYTGYTLGETDETQLQQLCLDLAEELDTVRALLPEDIYTSQDFEAYAELSVTAIAKLAETYPVLERSLYSKPKPVLLSDVMSQAGISGVFFPFTMESNINKQVPFYMIPSTMAHELAHQSGFMREDEANFIAYLASQKVDDPLMNYSGLSLAFNHAISALNRVDAEQATFIRENLSEKVQEDRAYYAAYLSDYRGLFYHFSTKVNDTYLKANNQSDGVASYGRMVELMLAERREVD
ncbi:DUF3810 domain-containing protein [Enterococcus sp. HY326]|uniref:DUF3810 domain-containing protein n=1 Tax=Enterococcus sp. HY326 TaxID=2971265 RepID=UPI0022405104|nr:DUF3810 domain-containing protein [Enterococcus sp. HY326]